MNQKITLWKGIVLCLFILSVLLLNLLHSYSLNPMVSGGPNAESPRQKDNHTFLLPIDLDPVFYIPVRFDELNVLALETGEHVDAQGYLHDLDDTFWRSAVGFYNKGELKQLSEHDGLVSLEHANMPKECCICVLFPELPARDCPIKIRITYQVMGVLPKTEYLTYYWD